jgi:hypothetical protein
LAEGFEIKVLVSIRKIDFDTDGLFFSVGFALDGQAIGSPSLHSQAADFRDQGGGGQNKIHSA